MSYPSDDDISKRNALFDAVRQIGEVKSMAGQIADVMGGSVMAEVTPAYHAIPSNVDLRPVGTQVIGAIEAKVQPEKTSNEGVTISGKLDLKSGQFVTAREEALRRKIEELELQVETLQNGNAQLTEENQNLWGTLTEASKRKNMLVERNKLSVYKRYHGQIKELKSEVKCQKYLNQLLTEAIREMANDNRILTVALQAYETRRGSDWTQ